MVHAGLSGCCILVGAFITHGLAGQLHHKSLLKNVQEELSEDARAWRFWQPFRCPLLLHALSQALCVLHQCLM